MKSRTSEAWLPIVGYEGLYEVSDRGRVRSLPRNILRSDGKLQPIRGRILKLAVAGEFGVVTVKLSRDNRPMTHKVSHLVARAFLGPRPSRLVVRHLNDIQVDNDVVNLTYGTASENMADMLRNGNNRSANKELCPRGHELREPNLVARFRRGGGRTCLACARARSWVQRHPLDEFAIEADRRYNVIMQHETAAA